MMTHHSHNEQNNTQCGGAELRRPRVPSAHYVTDHGHDVYIIMVMICIIMVMMIHIMIIM